MLWRAPTPRGSQGRRYALRPLSRRFDAQAQHGQIDPVKTPGVVQERCITALANVADDPSHGLIDIGRDLALARQEAANASSKSASVVARRNGMARLGSNSVGTLAVGGSEIGLPSGCCGLKSTRQIGPKSFISASTHSTCSRMAPPSAKSRVTKPSGGALSSKVTASRESTVLLFFRSMDCTCAPSTRSNRRAARRRAYPSAVSSPAAAIQSKRLPTAANRRSLGRSQCLRPG